MRGEARKNTPKEFCNIMEDHDHVSQNGNLNGNGNGTHHVNGAAPAEKSRLRPRRRKLSHLEKPFKGISRIIESLEANIPWLALSLEEYEDRLAGWRALRTSDRFAVRSGADSVFQKAWESFEQSNGALAAQALAVSEDLLQMTQCLREALGPSDSEYGSFSHVGNILREADSGVELTYPFADEKTLPRQEIMELILSATMVLAMVKEMREVR
jgi:hypothetical protein